MSTKKKKPKENDFSMLSHVPLLASAMMILKVSHLPSVETLIHFLKTNEKCGEITPRRSVMIQALQAAKITASNNWRLHPRKPIEKIEKEK